MSYQQPRPDDQFSRGQVGCFGFIGLIVRSPIVDVGYAINSDNLRRSRDAAQATQTVRPRVHGLWTTSALLRAGAHPGAHNTRAARHDSFCLEPRRR